MKSVLRVIVSAAALLLVSPYAASAQEVPIPAAPAKAAPAPAETNAPATQATPGTPAVQPAAPADQPLLKPAELDALVAPIALYPDDLLSLVFMASTYPLEVVEAQRWFDANKKLGNEQRKAALNRLDWDQSVKSLIATPTVLEMMSTQLQWTRKLGDAVLAQQADVMDAVQRLRARAHSRDKLVTTKQQRVTVNNTGPRQVIAIEPVDPNLIYVPYYEPAVVYGDWPYADYPPYFFPYGGYIGDGLLAGGLWFGAGYALGYWGGGSYWGGRCNWANNNIYYRNGNRWTHRSEHRRGVGYGNDRLQRQFGNRQGGRDQLNFRGRDGRQVVRPSADRANRAGAADRRGGARAGDARGSRAGHARTGQAARTRSGQRNVHRYGATNRTGQRHGFQHGRAGSRYSNHTRMDFRGYGGRNVRGGGGGFRSDGFRGGYRGGSAGFRGGDGFRVGGGAFRSGGGGFRGGGSSFGGGGGFRGGGASFGGGGGFRGGGGGGGRGGGGGGHRSDIRLKEDVALVGRLDSGLGLYRFRYRGEPETYVGVMAQDAMMVAPDAVTRGSDGYFRVQYDRIGFEMQSYKDWVRNAGKARGL